MDIADIVSEDYVALHPETPVSKLAGTFADRSIRGVVVEDDEFRGVVTRRQLTASRHPPDETLASVVWHVPRLGADEDIRTVARLMLEGDSRLLPVFEGQELVGVVTVDDVLRKVQPFLEEATVGDVATRDVISVAPEATFGEALHVLRENRFTHLPVVEGREPVGILSLYDVTEFAVRSMQQSSGGDADATDAFGGSTAKSAGRSRAGGFGAREGESTRMLDLPVRDLMASPVRTVDPAATLAAAVDAMFEIEASSLVVTPEDEPFGIVTKSDVLDSLTWETEGTRPVQVYGMDLLDDAAYGDVVEMVDGFDDRDGDMRVIDAKVHLQEHDERLRGTPLLLARVRLATDRGLFVASGEGYGAAHALREARDVLERQLRDRKTHGETKKHPDADYWERRFGWLLEA